VGYRDTLDEVNKNAYDVFKKFLPESKTFVETGCHYGNSLVHAVNAGYETVYSCDIFPERVKYSNARVAGMCKKAVIKNKKSIDFLKDILPELEEGATFWLDAHNEGGGIPTFKELELIRDYLKNKNSTIIIDDIPLYFKNTISQLKALLFEINPQYDIEFEYIHPDRKNYILIAAVKETNESSST